MHIKSKKKSKNLIENKLVIKNYITQAKLNDFIWQTNENISKADKKYYYGLI